MAELNIPPSPISRALQEQNARKGFAGVPKPEDNPFFRLLQLLGVPAKALVSFQEQAQARQAEMGAPQGTPLFGTANPGNAQSVISGLLAAILRNTLDNWTAVKNKPWPSGVPNPFTGAIATQVPFPAPDTGPLPRDVQDREGAYGR